MFGAALAALLVLIIDYALAFSRWGGVEFAWTPLNTVVVLTAWVLPLIVLRYFPPVHRLVGWVVRSALVLVIVGEGLVALLTLLYVPMTISTGYDSGRRPLYATNAGRDRLVVYASPSFEAFEGWGIDIRQERDVIPGLKRVRPIYYAKAGDASIQMEGTDSLRIITWSDANRSGQSRDTVVAFAELP